MEVDLVVMSFYPPNAFHGCRDGDAGPPRRPTWLPLVVAIALSLALFAVLARSVLDRSVLPWDAAITHAVDSLASPAVTPVMRVVSFMGKRGLVVLTVVIAVWLWLRRRRLDSMTIFVGVVGAVGLNDLLKLLFARQPPGLSSFFGPEALYSFPSGHVTAATAFYGLIGLRLWQSGHRAWGGVFFLWILAVAVSRIYLGTHYPSDTAGSLLVGIPWVLAVALAHRGLSQRG